MGVGEKGGPTEMGVIVPLLDVSDSMFGRQGAPEAFVIGYGVLIE